MIKAVDVFLCFRLQRTAEKTDHPVFKLIYSKGRGHSKLMTGWNKKITTSDYWQLAASFTLGTDKHLV